MSTVTVVGAAGHVGLPFSLVCADAGHTVYGLDLNVDLVAQLNMAKVPYVEHGAEELLREHLYTTKRLQFTTDRVHVMDSDVVAIMLGTPVDEENNPRLDYLINFVDSTLTTFIKPGTLVLLRSTVAPGTTEIIKNRIEQTLNWKEGKDFYLVFCPERVLQTKGIEETKNLPTIVGAFCNESYFKAKEFLETFSTQFISHLTPEEAEVAKLMTNMWRYVSFAFANEMWMIGEKRGIDMHRVINAANLGYKRMDVPLPGPNVGGPCLFKDGRFLLQDVPFVDLIQTSFIINEGMPDYLWGSITKLNKDIKNVLILGATFKADCDDIRNSLSFKMKKVCEKHGAKVTMKDPYVEEYKNVLSWVEPEKTMKTLREFDAVIIMTPHNEFSYVMPKDFKEDCVIADVWKLLEESRFQPTGIYQVSDIGENNE